MYFVEVPVAAKMDTLAVKCYYGDHAWPIFPFVQILIRMDVPIINMCNCGSACNKKDFPGSSGDTSLSIDTSLRLPHLSIADWSPV